MGVLERGKGQPACVAAFVATAADLAVGVAAAVGPLSQVQQLFLPLQHPLSYLVSEHLLQQLLKQAGHSHCLLFEQAGEQH